jgi:hypothetical protein
MGLQLRDKSSHATPVLLWLDVGNRTGRQQSVAVTASISCLTETSQIRFDPANVRRSRHSARHRVHTRVLRLQPNRRRSNGTAAIRMSNIEMPRIQSLRSGILDTGKMKG